MKENIVTCSKCGDHATFKGETPDDVTQQTGYTWGIFSESESAENPKMSEITEDMMWLCPNCNKDEDKEVGC